MTRQTILENAIQCVTKDRNATHGEPEDNFNTIARYWQIYLESIGVFKSYKDEGGSRNLEPTDIAVLMILIKVSRLSTSPEHPDHWTDIAGYAACGGGIATGEKKFRTFSCLCGETLHETYTECPVCKAKVI